MALYQGDFLIIISISDFCSDSTRSSSLELNVTVCHKEEPFVKQA